MKDMPDTIFPDRPFTVTEAKSWGSSPRQLAYLAEMHMLQRVCRGVYAPAHLEIDQDLRIQSLALVAAPHQVACDRTAAWLHGIDVRRYADLDVPPPLEFFALRGRARSRRPDMAGGSRDLNEEDVMEINGFWVTTPLRTALDLACNLPRREALAALDAFARDHGICKEQLSVLLQRFRRRRGVVQARELVPLVDSRAESPRESWVRLDVLDYGLPCPRPQYWIYIDGVPTYRLDLAYPHARIAIEYDGAEWHSSEDDHDRDQDRREWLEEHGWIVIVVTAEEMMPETKHLWLRRVEKALAQRRTRRAWTQRKYVLLDQ